MPITRVPDPSELTESSSAGSTSMPATSSSSGSQVAASTRSSPSATNSPVRSRCFFSWSLRIVFSCSLCGEVIMERKRAPLGAPWEWFLSVGCSGSRRLPGALGKPSEGLGVADGDVRQDLAVQLDLRQAEAVHELAVGQPLAPRRGVDAGDPEAAEVALPVAAVAVGVAVGPLARPP